MSSSPRHFATRESKSDVSQMSLECPIEAQGFDDGTRHSSCNASGQRCTERASSPFTEVKERARVHRIGRRIEKLEEQTAGMGAHLSIFGKKESRPRTRAAREKRKWIEEHPDGHKYSYRQDDYEAAKRFTTVEEIEEEKRRIMAWLDVNIADLERVSKATKEFFQYM